jgi:large subunit ribosomal protein L29
MKNSVIREMKTDEVADKISEEIAQLSKLKMNNSVSPLENPLQLRYKKRNIARLKTELTKRNKAAK